MSTNQDVARDIDDSMGLGAGELPTPSDSIPQLVGRLVEKLASTRPSTSLDSEGKQVLFDVDLDGCRYRLVRSALPREGVNLSPRELEIARMVARGFPSKTIAGVLEISTWTVSTHLRRIFAKLGVSSRAAMVACLLGESPAEFAHQPTRFPSGSAKVHDQLPRLGL